MVETLVEYSIVFLSLILCPEIVVIYTNMHFPAIIPWYVYYVVARNMSRMYEKTLTKISLDDCVDVKKGYNIECIKQINLTISVDTCATCLYYHVI